MKVRVMEGTMRTVKRKEIKLAVDLDNYYQDVSPEQRSSLRQIYQSLDGAVIAALWTSTHLFPHNQFDITGALHMATYIVYDIFYDEYNEEYELSGDDIERAMDAMIGLVADLYPVVMQYARYLYKDGKDPEWIEECIDSVEWHIEGHDDIEMDEEFDYVTIIAEVLDYHDFINSN